MPGVKAGDLAIVRAPEAPRYHGRIVEILYPAPDEEFNLPDGTPHLRPAKHPSWVLKLIGGRAPVVFSCGTTKQVLYGVGADSNLFPLPGDKEDLGIETADPVTVGSGSNSI